MTPATHWIVMSALCYKVILCFTGKPTGLFWKETQVEAITLPRNLVGWLTAIGIYKEIKDEANTYKKKNIDHGYRDALFLLYGSYFIMVSSSSRFPRYQDANMDLISS